MKQMKGRKGGGKKGKKNREGKTEKNPLKLYFKRSAFYLQ